MPASALNKASDFAFCTSLPIVAEGIGQASPEAGLFLWIPFIARAWRADKGGEVFVMGSVAHDVVPQLRQAQSGPAPMAPSSKPAVAGFGCWRAEGSAISEMPA